MSKNRNGLTPAPPRVRLDRERLLGLAVRAAELFGWAIRIDLDDPDRPVLHVRCAGVPASWPLPVREVMSLCKVNGREWKDFTPAQKQRLIEQYLKSLSAG